MTSSPELSFVEPIYDAYHSSRAFHGEFGFTVEEYVCGVCFIVGTHLGSKATNSESLSMCRKLHLLDLYLAIGCARRSESAWQRFSTLYDNFIHDLARFYCATKDCGRELGDSIAGHLFLPDRSGHSRIASFDGRCTLKTWLRAVIKNRAIDEQQLRSNNNECLDSLPETADESSLQKLELMLRAGRYECEVAASLKQAVESLSEDDRRLLALKYAKEVSTADLAVILDVHPTTILRKLSRTHAKVRERVVSILATRFLLNAITIDECLEEIIANPKHSILKFLD